MKGLAHVVAKVHDVWDVVWEVHPLPAFETHLSHTFGVGVGDGEAMKPPSVAL